MSRLLSRGDLLALVDRAAPVVGQSQEDSDPVAPGMLFTDALVLLDQLALRTTGLPVNALVRRHRASQRKLQQLAATCPSQVAAGRVASHRRMGLESAIEYQSSPFK